ncbi:MAG: DALR anticodon-binding domain-containing protein, partial [Cyanobacteria bacterium J06555_12]
TAAIDSAVLKEAEETALFEASKTVYSQGQAALAANDYSLLVSALLDTAPTVTRFFDAVLVMDKEPAVRTNRLNLLSVLSHNAQLLADFGAVVMSGDA